MSINSDPESSKMTDLKLWYAPGACSLAPLILLIEAGLDFETVKLDLKAGFHASYAKLNPKMRVPLLSLNNQTITEIPAIITAISQLAPSHHFLGATPIEIVRSYEWLAWLSGHVHGLAFGCLVRPARYSDEESAWPGIQAKGKLEVDKAFEKIEEDLKGLHAVGERFTAVDLMLYVFYRWGMGMGLEMGKQYPGYKKLVENILERQSVKTALEREGADSLVYE